VKRSEPKGHDLLREHHAKVMEEMKELVSKVSSLERRIESLRLFVVSGEGSSTRGSVSATGARSRSTRSSTT